MLSAANSSTGVGSGAWSTLFIPVVKTVLIFYRPFQALNFTIFLSIPQQWPLSLVRKGCGEDGWFVHKHSTVIDSLHIEQLEASLLTIISHIKKSPDEV